MKFTKMQGAGNDYIYLDARGLDEDWPSLSRAMSEKVFTRESMTGWTR